ncbi:MAG: hemerythrin domain-containing protein [Steroidobacteraceae bacterium]
MFLFNRIIAAVTPEESQSARQEARSKARAAAKPADWLSMALSHHMQLEAAFAELQNGNGYAARIAAHKSLAILLTGHAIAEESVLYPALAQIDELDHATTAYIEQATAKMEMAELASLDPMSPDFLAKLDHIRGAVFHHMYEEEGTWFLELKDKLSEPAQAKLSQQFQEEFERYAGTDQAWVATRRMSRAGT